MIEHLVIPAKLLLSLRINLSHGSSGWFSVPFILKDQPLSEPPRQIHQTMRTEDRLGRLDPPFLSGDKEDTCSLRLICKCSRLETVKAIKQVIPVHRRSVPPFQLPSSIVKNRFQQTEPFHLTLHYSTSGAIVPLCNF
jgi:hypothetical protein